MHRFFIFFLLLFFYCVSSAQASRKIIIKTDLNSLLENQELVVMASVSGFTTGDKLHVKGAFYKDGSSNYFGYTKYNNSWIKNSVATLEQPRVEIGNWDNSMIVKLDPLDTGFSGAGEYKFKLGYYYFTNTGNLSSVNWSENCLDLRLDAVIPSPSSVSYSENEPYSVELDFQESSSMKSENSNTVSSKSLNTTNTLIPSKIPSKSVKIASDSKSASQYASIKAITQPENEEIEVAVLGTNDSDKIYLTYFFSGFLFLVIAGIVLVRKVVIKK